MIARFPRKAYLLPMIATRLMLILAMLAMLVAPLSMSGESAMAASLPESSLQQQSVDQASHCNEMAGEDQGETDGRFPQSDCLSDCAMACSALAAPGSRMIEPEVAAVEVAMSLPVDALHGLNPESADPPPRTA
jgi:hypothetical protein